MIYPLYAITTTSRTPVLIDRFPTQSARNAAQRREQEQQDSLGGDEVLGFIYELSGGAEATQSPAADTRTYGQLALI